MLVDSLYDYDTNNQQLITNTYLMTSPIICAIDTPNLSTASTLAQKLVTEVAAIKLGLEFFCAHGQVGVLQVIPENTQLFLDLKLHDIPNTVAKSIASLASLNPHMLTLHASGGREMMEHARSARDAQHMQTKLLGVTLLTSLDAEDLESIGMQPQPLAQTLRLATLAQRAGLQGVICSGHEIEALRAECGEDFLLVVPGIRPTGSEAHDQKRTLTPREALAKGADYLVIGRPITQSADPLSAARALLA